MADRAFSRSQTMSTNWADDVEEDEALERGERRLPHLPLPACLQAAVGRWFAATRLHMQGVMAVRIMHAWLLRTLGPQACRCTCSTAPHAQLPLMPPAPTPPTCPPTCPPCAAVESLRQLGSPRGPTPGSYPTSPMGGRPPARQEEPHMPPHAGGGGGYEPFPTATPLPEHPPFKVCLLIRCGSQFVGWLYLTGPARRIVSMVHRSARPQQQATICWLCRSNGSRRSGLKALPCLLLIAYAPLLPAPCRPSWATFPMTWTRGWWPTSSAASRCVCGPEFRGWFGLFRLVLVCVFFQGGGGPIPCNRNIADIVVPNARVISSVNTHPSLACSATISLL